MPRLLTQAVLSLAATVALWTPLLGQIDAADRAALADLADRGDAATVWRTWDRLPVTPDSLRLGVELAARLGDISRGVDLFERLRQQTEATESPTLRALVVAVAGRLAGEADLDARVIGCSAALRLDNTLRPCRQALEDLADRGTSPAERALGSFALAEAGLRGVPGPTEDLTRVSPSTRLHLATQFRDLPTPARLELIEPVLRQSDLAYQYQAVLLVGHIDHPASVALLQTLTPTATPVRVGRLVALSALGDAAATTEVRQIYDALDDNLQILGGLALARMNDARGSNALDQSLRSPNESVRNYGAEVVLRLNPGALVTPLLEALDTGSASGRAGATRVAGLAGLGDAAAVVRQLTDTDSLVRAETVAAIGRAMRSTPAAGRP